MYIRGVYTKDMTKTAAVETITTGMSIIPEGRTYPVEVLIVEDHTDYFLIGHVGKGFDVTRIEAGALVEVAA